MVTAIIKDRKGRETARRSFRDAYEAEIWAYAQDYGSVEFRFSEVRR